MGGSCQKESISTFPGKILSQSECILSCRTFPTNQIWARGGAWMDDWVLCIYSLWTHEHHRWVWWLGVHNPFITVCVKRKGFHSNGLHAHGKPLHLNKLVFSTVAPALVACSSAHRRCFWGGNSELKLPLPGLQPCCYATHMLMRHSWARLKRQLGML